ncbi:retrotransposon protein, putative, ty1-copia subclass [Tanacetum coccineum]
MDGEVHTYKARLVAVGFTQTYGIDYEETFSPVADIRAIRILIAIAAYYDYEIWQMDVKTAFLNGRLDEDIYMVQPEGYVNPKYPNRVCKLQRSIYGLKQASRQWNKRFDEEIKKFGFTQNRDEPCVYRKASGSNVVFLILYVDDILIMGNNIPRLKEVKDYLGKFRCTRPDVAFVSKLGFKVDSQNQGSSWVAVTHILELSEDYERYVFSVYGGNPDNRNLCYRAVDWKSKKQTTIAMSATQAEYMAASKAAMEAVWIKKFVGDLGRYPYVREQVKSGEIKVLKVHTDDNLADPFTKALPKGNVTDHANGIGLQLVVVS